MAIQIRPARKRLSQRTPKADVPRDNRLTFMDHAGIQFLRATGRGQLIQVVWIYEHPVDYDTLRRFNENFGYGLAGRRIERSPLPFARHRWVSSLGAAASIDFVESPRPREELSDWADEFSQVPVDPETGPGWHMAVQPLTDGSTAISITGSHHLGDGVGALLTVVEAVNASQRDIGYPLPQSRTYFRATMADLRDTTKDARAVAHAVVAGVKMLNRSRYEEAASVPKPRAVSVADNDEIVVVPAISVLVDLEQWDARAKALNGTNYSLFAAFAAKLGEHLGRQRADGTVSLIVALNDRTSLDDTRANAMLFAPVNLDPAPVIADLTDARVAIRQALKTAREVPDPMLELLPIVPLVPRRLLRRVVEQFLGTGAELPVSCSNLGDFPAEIARPDGTDAEYVLVRGVDQNVRRADIERAGGQLVAVAGRIGGKVTVGIIGYQVGAENSKPRLRELAARTLAEFDLTGEIF
ncbi:hypothetical protein [Mycobacterium sp.]|uniref:hypothetical protein n=1 Tax=Mycobacterium sp. TaxID=1785 RepID=UPI002CB1B6E8|nr:hypothetical protein [Mycobacterium sp.]HKP40605.1 hypothetical protein [Mycobacterium sp.]